MMKISDNQGYPTISIIIPIQNEDRLIVERINMAFQFAKQYKGACEVIAVSDGADSQRCKIAWLALKLNKVKEPTIRTAMPHHPNPLGLNETIKTGLARSLGEKIIVLIDPTHKNGSTNINPKEVHEEIEIAENLNAIKNVGNISINNTLYM
jgi:cellulose synthase/poly-beta-1,6-N-acetylglucosamine synthase-like glycosyltransferase